MEAHLQAWTLLHGVLEMGLLRASDSREAELGITVTCMLLTNAVCRVAVELQIPGDLPQCMQSRTIVVSASVTYEGSLNATSLQLPGQA